MHDLEPVARPSLPHPREPIVLSGRHVRLDPLAADHLDALCAVGLEPSLWEWTISRVRTREEMRAYIGAALDARAGGTALPFVIVHLGSGRVVGSTRLANHSARDGRVEIGWSWVAPAWQRSAVNTEAKLLLLTYAFERLRLERVELKTDALNARSRAAIARLGAREEGTLRRHMRTDAGRLRDTVYFSILADEWPDVRAQLMARLSEG